MLNHRFLCILIGAFFVASIPRAHAAIDARVEIKQEQETVVLKWRIPGSGYLAYETNLDNIESGKGNSFRFNLEEFMDGEDAPRDMPDKLEFKLPETFSATTILQPADAGKIHVKLYANPTEEKPGAAALEDPDQDEEQDPDMGEMLNKLMKQMEGTILLRGEIDDTGAMESFYLSQRQKNLIALLFELPSGPVSAGDTWALDVSLLQMGDGFICDDAYRENTVSLVSLIHTDQGETIAVLRYFIYEAVEGRFAMPALPASAPDMNFKKQMDMSMSMGFAGEAEFLVNEGRWRKFTGVLETKSSGFMSSSVQQNLALKHTDYVKQELLDME